MIKRPLLWILGGWILGEIVAGWLGIASGTLTTLDDTMAERDSLYVTVNGRVHSIQETAAGIQIRITENEVFGNGDILETHDLLIREGKEIRTAFPLSSLKPGNRIHVTGFLSAFQTPGNPGEFNQRDYYRVQGLDYLLKIDSLEVLEEDIFWQEIWAEQLRERIRHSIAEITSDEEAAGLFLALSIGERTELSEETKALYQAGGILHLLAISALHLSLLGMGLWKGLRRIGMTFLASGVAAAVFLLGYVWFSGGAVSSWRAFLMFVVMLGAAVLGRTYDLLSALGLAGLLLLWEQPLYARQAAFQLSFAAMAGIGILYPEVLGWCGVGDSERKRDGAADGSRTFLIRKSLQRMLLLSLSVQLATLPVIAWHYGTVSVYGIFLNLLAVPLMSYALPSVFCSSLLGIFWPGAGRLLAGSAELIFRFYELLCRLALRLPCAQWVTGRPGWISIVFWILFLAAGIFCWQRESLRRKKDWRSPSRVRQSFPRKGNVFFLLLVYAAGIFLLSVPPRAELTVTSLDVGQGDCSVVLLPGRGACLIDGGSASVSKVGERRILPYLKYEGISELEMIFLSHADQDHINGITEILQNTLIPVRGLAIPAASADDPGWDEIMNLAKEKEIPVYPMKAGDEISFYEVRFQCLSPGTGGVPSGSQEEAKEEEDSNELSLVLLLKYSEFRGLFTGDISSQVENQLALPEKITWLKAAHHGSRFSTGEAFLAETEPELTVISCGENNRYGHPHAETLQRLEDYGAIIHQTTVCGAIRLTVGERMSGSCFRSGETWELSFLH